MTTVKCGATLAMHLITRQWTYMGNNSPPLILSGMFSRLLLYLNKRFSSSPLMTGTFATQSAKNAQDALDIAAHAHPLRTALHQPPACPLGHRDWGYWNNAKHNVLMDTITSTEDPEFTRM
jgi:hypothetical protein